MADAWQSAWVEVLPDFSNFRRDATPGITSILGGAGDEGGRVGARNFGSSFIGGVGKLALPIAGAFAALGFGNLIADAVRGGIDFALGTIGIASDLNESVNAVQVSYGAIADEILVLGENSARTFGLSKRDLNGYAVQFSSFAKTIAGEGGDVAGSFSSILGRATDFASVMNLDVNEALALFQSGLAGETEPLRKYGIDLSAAAVEAHAYATGIGTAGTALTEGEKVQARYSYLLEQTGAVAGDFANTSDELANKQRIQAALWDDLQGKIGEGFLPIAERVTDFLVNDLFPAFDSLVDEHGPQIAEAFGALLPAFEQLADELLPKLPGLFESVAEMLPLLIEGATQLLPPLIDFIGALVNGALQIQDFFTKFGEALDNGAAQWQGFAGWVAEIWNAIVGAYENGAAQIGGFFEFFGGALSNGAAQWQGFAGWVAGVWGAITGAFSNGWSQISGFFSNLAGAFANGAGQIGSFAATVGQKVGEVIGFIGSLPGRVAGFFADAGSWLVNSGRALIQGFINGIKGMIGAVGDAVGSVIEWARGFFPNSPAKRGPLSGSGWNKLAQSGEDFISQWTTGFARPDLTDALTPVLSAPRAGHVSPYASSASIGASGPKELVVVDADRQLIGRMRVEAGGVVSTAAALDDTRWRSGEKSL